MMLVKMDMITFEQPDKRQVGTFLDSVGLRKLFGVNRRTIFRWRKLHGLDAVGVRIGGRVLFPLTEVLRWMQNTTEKGYRLWAFVQRCFARAMKERTASKALEKKLRAHMKVEAPPVVQALRDVAFFLKADPEGILRALATGLGIAVALHKHEKPSVKVMEATMYKIVPKEFIPYLKNGRL